MATVRDLITASLRLIQEVGAGEVCTAESAVDGLSALNRMIASWSVDKDVIYTESAEVFNLTSGSHTIGSGADFNTVRPVNIEQMFITDGGQTYPLWENDSTQYALIADKETIGRPTDFYYDGNYPVGTIKFYPVPDKTYQLNIYSRKALSQFTAITDNVVLPNGYERALIYNLAVEIAPEYGKEAPQSVQLTAAKSLRAIESGNNANDSNSLRVDYALTNGTTFDIYSGDQ